MNELKKQILQSMQTTSHEIKYHKQFIESAVRRHRETTKGDIWAEMTTWYDLINDLEYATREIRKSLLRYHDLHDVLKMIDNQTIKEAK